MMIYAGLFRFILKMHGVFDIIWSFLSVARITHIAKISWTQRCSSLILYISSAENSMSISLVGSEIKNEALIHAEDFNLNIIQ